MNKLKKLIERVRAFRWKLWIKRVLVALILAALPVAMYYGANLSYEQGYEAGRLQGKCEIACPMLTAQYGFVDDEGQCWCKMGTNSYMVLPFYSQEN